MVAEDQQTFEGLMQHLTNAFQSGKTVSELISDFYCGSQKRNGSDGVFVDDLQILVQKIIAWKPEFWVNGNDQLKNQYAHKLWDLYYVAIACSVLQMSDSIEFHTILGPSGNDIQWKDQVRKNQLPCIISGSFLLHYTRGS